MQIVVARKKNINLILQFHIVFFVKIRFCKIKNDEKTMSVWTSHCPMSTLTCALRVQLDVGNKKKTQKDSVAQMSSSTPILQV